MSTLASDITKSMVNHVECILWARHFRSVSNRRAAAAMLSSAAKHRKQVEFLKDFERLNYLATLSLSGANA